MGATDLKEIRDYLEAKNDAIEAMMAIMNDPDADWEDRYDFFKNTPEDLWRTERYVWRPESISKKEWEELDYQLDHNRHERVNVREIVEEAIWAEMEASWESLPDVWPEIPDEPTGSVKLLFEEVTSKRIGAYINDW